MTNFLLWSRKLRLLAALLLSLGLHAATLTFANASTTNLTFASSTITWAGAISGTGSIDGIALNWNITAIPSDELTWNGAGSPFTLNNSGNSLTLNVNDGSFGDSLNANFMFTEGRAATGPDITDLAGAFSFSAVHIATVPLVNYLDLNFGAVPTVGETGTFDLNFSCGTATACLSVDPIGILTSGDLVFSASTGGVPEPASDLLVGFGIAALVAVRRRNKHRY